VAHAGDVNAEDLQRFWRGVEALHLQTQQ
jgi:hypothetical protein